MDRWAVSLSGPETAVNSPSQPFQALHAWRRRRGFACAGGGDVHACERGERGTLGELGQRGELGGHARIDSELGITVVVQIMAASQMHGPGQRAMQ